MPLFLATHNRHKQQELAQLLASHALEIEVRSPPAGAQAVEETGSSFAENAKIKCSALQSITPVGAWILADDSGLEVDVLDGAPGVFSARYAGEPCSDEANTLKLLKALEGIPMTQRKARFVCVLCLIGASEMPQFFHGICEGHITLEAFGNHGFGYDSVFQPMNYQETFGTLPASIKNTLSHRANALSQLINWLKKKK